MEKKKQTPKLKTINKNNFVSEMNCCDLLLLDIKADAKLKYHLHGGSLIFLCCFNQPRKIVLINKKKSPVLYSKLSGMNQIEMITRKHAIFQELFHAEQCYY